VNLKRINEYIEFGHYPIPNVQGTLASLLPYVFFMDLDLSHSFYQLKLSKETSEKLSVQTPWGQYEPMYLPEGCAPATAALQQAMDDIFGDLGPWCHLLFDNILIGGVTPQDCYEKLSLFLDRAREFNVYLKIEKTWIGLKEVKFFNYMVTGGKFYLEESRSAAIDLVSFPTGTPAQNGRAMRSFLGQTRIFQQHVPDYTAISSPLDKMAGKTFDWDESTWKLDYRDHFERLKKGLKTAMVLFMPDYNKEWILRTDACNTGYGGVLYQVSVTEEGKREYEPLKFISRKFSDAATRWDTFSQECYGIFACVKENASLLIGKPFIIETDHQNLKWAEASEVPKIIRQCLYLRQFTCWVRHMPGKSNTADYWSRLLGHTEKNLNSLYLDRHGQEGVSSLQEEELLYNLCAGTDDNEDFFNDEAWLAEVLQKSSR
jgi:hypothetical protein